MTFSANLINYTHKWNDVLFKEKKNFCGKIKKKKINPMEKLKNKKKENSFFFFWLKKFLQLAFPRFSTSKKFSLTKTISFFFLNLSLNSKK